MFFLKMKFFQEYDLLAFNWFQKHFIKVFEIESGNDKMRRKINKRHRNQSQKKN